MGNPEWASDRPERETRGLGVASRFVLQGSEPLRVVVHHNDDTWSFACGTTDRADDLVTVHAQEMFGRFGYDLFHLRDLCPGSVAERNDPSEEWVISPYHED